MISNLEEHIDKIGNKYVVPVLVGVNGCALEEIDEILVYVNNFLKYHHQIEIIFFFLKF